MTLAWLLWKSSLLGMLRGGASFLMEHPLDVVKTCWQANPHILSWKELAQSIYSQKGWRGFYAGCVPNTLRVVLKHAYRTPLLLLCHYIVFSFWQQEAPILVGLFIAFLEVGIIQPLERLKVWIMTSPYKSQIMKEFIRQKIYLSLYKGWSATWPKQVVSWVTFLWFTYALQLMWAHYELSGTDIIVPLIVGLINTLFILPFDAIKTHMQCYQANERGWLATLLMIARQYGARGFYVGFSARLIQYIIQALWTAPILYRLVPYIHKLAAVS